MVSLLTLSKRLSVMYPIAPNNISKCVSLKLVGPYPVNASNIDITSARGMLCGIIISSYFMWLMWEDFHVACVNETV